MTLLDTAKSCDFLKCPAHEDSEKVYHVYGGQKFARLAVREVCVAFSLIFLKRSKKNDIQVVLEHKTSVAQVIIKGFEQPVFLELSDLKSLLLA